MGISSVQISRIISKSLHATIQRNAVTHCFDYRAKADLIGEISAITAAVISTRVMTVRHSIR